MRRKENVSRGNNEREERSERSRRRRGREGVTLLSLGEVSQVVWTLRPVRSRATEGGEALSEGTKGSDSCHCEILAKNGQGGCAQARSEADRRAMEEGGSGKRWSLRKDESFESASLRLLSSSSNSYTAFELTQIPSFPSETVMRTSLESLDSARGSSNLSRMPGISFFPLLASRESPPTWGTLPPSFSSLSNPPVLPLLTLLVDPLSGARDRWFSFPNNFPPSLSLSPPPLLSPFSSSFIFLMKGNGS